MIRKHEKVMNVKVKLRCLSLLNVLEHGQTHRMNVSYYFLNSLANKSAGFCESSQSDVR